MRLGSWNVNGLQARVPNLLRWLTDRCPDVVGLQELRTSRTSPLRRFEDLGYHIAASDHVALLSIHPMDDVAEPTADGRSIAATIDGIRVVNTYAPNGYKARTPKHVHKLHWLRDFSSVVSSQAAMASDVVLLGDFNVARGPLDVWAPGNYRGRNLFTAEERAAFESVIGDNALIDVLRDRHEAAGLYTWWNYAHTAFSRNRGWRLDYIFANKTLAERVSHAVVDVEERGRERTSDHAPLWIDLD